MAHVPNRLRSSTMPRLTVRELEMGRDGPLERRSTLVMEWVPGHRAHVLVFMST